MGFEIKKNLTITHIYIDFISISKGTQTNSLIPKGTGVRLSGILDNLYEPTKNLL